MCPQREQSRSQETQTLVTDLVLTQAMVTFPFSGLQSPNLGNRTVGMDDLYDHFQLSQPTHVLSVSSCNLYQFTTGTLGFLIRMRRSPCSTAKGGMAMEKFLPWDYTGRLGLLAKLGHSKYQGVSNSQQFPHGSPMAGNVTVAIPKQLLFAWLKGQPPPSQSHPSVISLWHRRPRWAHSSSGFALKGKCLTQGWRGAVRS